MMADFLANLFARLTTGATTYTILFLWDEPKYED